MMTESAGRTDFRRPLNDLLSAVLLGFVLALPLPVAAQQGDPQHDDVIEVPGATLGRMGESATVDPNEYDFSRAEDLLWMHDHLANIDEPVRLHYEFVKSGSFEEGFTDIVYLDILQVNDDGTKDAQLRFFTGARAQGFNADNVTQVRGNPVIGTYMFGDVKDMNRLTNGSWRYFQRAIKMAIAHEATVEHVSFDYHGRDVQGERITITPYVRDPRRRQFEQFSGKKYEFLLSSEVPGTLYQINTVIPGPTDQPAEPLIQETLTLQGAHGAD